MKSFAGEYMSYLGVITTLVLAMGSLNSQGQTVQKSVHLEVILRPPNVRSGDTPSSPRLGKHSFEVKQGGKSLPFSLAKKGAVPKHLLVLMPQGLDTCRELKIDSLISSLLAKGWMIRVADSTGKTSKPLLGRDHWSSACNQLSSSVIPVELIKQFGQDAGRRVILFATKPSSDLLVHAVNAIPEIYSVDGGVPVDSKTHLMIIPKAPPVEGEEGPYYLPCHKKLTNKNDPCNLGTITTYRKSGFDRGVVHQKTIQGALKDLLYSPTYYDLTLNETSLSNLTDPIELSFRTTDDFSVTVGAYVEAQSSLSPASVRLKAPVPLIVHADRGKPQ